MDLGSAIALLTKWDKAFWISFLVMIPLALIIYHNDFILQFMNMDAHMADVTMNYLRAMVWGLPASFIADYFRCLNDGIAKTKPAMSDYPSLGLMLNIPLNYMFIYGKFGLRLHWSGTGRSGARRNVHSLR